MKELFDLQQRLVATKTNWNEFSNFSYRSLEDILQKAKPLLKELKCVITLSDEMIMLGDRYYIKSTATLRNENGEKESAIGWAREPLELKGMSAPQVTGTASSYARKYALASLLAIDDNKDIDSMDNRPKPSVIIPKVQPSKFAPHNNNHKEETIDNLEWSNEEERQPIAVIQQEKAPAEQLKEWFETQNQNDPIISRFYNYWYNRLIEQGWKGKFELNGLITKFCK